jgi:hypothetical protein
VGTSRFAARHMADREIQDPEAAAGILEGQNVGSEADTDTDMGAVVAVETAMAWAAVGEKVPVAAAVAHFVAVDFGTRAERAPGMIGRASLVLASVHSIGGQPSSRGHVFEA